MKKSARWKAFSAAVDKVGCVVEFPKKTAGDVAKMLCAGAQRRGSSMTPEVARLLVEQCGNDLNLLLNELDKLCALAGVGGVTREHVEQRDEKPRNLGISADKGAAAEPLPAGV